MAQPLQLDKNFFKISTSDTSNRYFIATTDDKRLFLYKHNFKYPLLKLNLSKKSKKTALCFFDENTIISGSIDGDIEFTSIVTASHLKSIHLFNKSISQILPIAGTNYIFIHTNTDSIAIIDAKNHKLIQKNYKIFKHNIQSIEFIDRYTLAVTLKNNSLVNIQLPSSNTLRSLILKNSIKDAFTLLENEPILQDTLEAKNLEKDFVLSYQRSVDALSINNKHLAEYILDTYKGIVSKQKPINLLFKSFEEYDRFKLHHREKKYAICYAIALRNPPLMLTNTYIKMQKRWHTLSKLAQKEVEKGNIKDAKVTLNDFITVNSKRDKIQKILSNTKDESIQDKQSILQNLYDRDDFFACYEHIDKYPQLYLCELGIYLQKHYLKLISISEEYARKGDIKMLKTTLGELIKLPSRKDRTRALLEISFIIRIQKQLQIDDFGSAKELIYSYIDLFGIDKKLTTLMKEYENNSKEVLAITIENESNWLESEFINS